MLQVFIFVSISLLPNLLVILTALPQLPLIKHCQLYSLPHIAPIPISVNFSLIEQ